MDELGFPQFYFTDEEVWNESKMLRIGLGGPQCYDCHLGNPRNYTAEGAHEGMPRLLVISAEGMKPIDRKDILPSLTPQRAYRPLMMVPEGLEVKTILYHDRDPVTLAPDPEIANKTCGKCHPRQWEDFSSSIMGLAKMQSQYPTFTDPPGPHNCGYWLVDFEKIKGEVAVNYTLEQAKLNERACQQCHTSCLDCHYIPTEGRHVFNRKPPTFSCYLGGGRGICHAGAEDFRRGAGYFREESSIPPLPPDIHAIQNITCLDCHKRSDHNISRKVTCTGCHKQIEQEMEESVHKNVSCEACHIQEVGGYQLTFWAPGNYWGVLTPLTKINNYGVLSNPILIKDQNGVWIPVKPVPHAVLNMEKELNRTGIEFRNIPGLRNESRDAYAVVGTFDNLPKNNKAILWIHMDKVSHGFGKARDCLSCHYTSEQRAKASWIMFNTKDIHVFPELKTPFTGEHDVIGNSSGVFVADLRNTSKIHEDDLPYAINFAPWLFGLRWSAPGDLSMPKKDKDACDKKCEDCHSSAHGTITPEYLTVKPYLTLIFAVALLAVAALAYSIVRRGY
jgi:hypothetical protein